MKEKVLTGFFIFIAIVLSIFSRALTPYIFDVLFLIIAVCASTELANCLNKKEKGIYKTATGYYPIVSYILFLLTYLAKLSWWWILFAQIDLLILTFVIMSIMSVARKEKMSQVWWTVFTFIYPSYMLFFFYLVNHNQTLLRTSADIGLVGLVLVLAVSTITDSAAMYTGMIFKGPKVWPGASPKKTISGCIGGLIFGALSAMIVFWIFNAIPAFHSLFVNEKVELWMFAIIGFATSFVGQLGDLLESKLKRYCEVKDMGNFFPGHGGFMDRVDSWSFSIIVVYLGLLILFI